MPEAEDKNFIDQIITYLINKINDVSGFFFELFGAIVLLMIVIGGIQYLTGNAESGKKTITAAIIGTVIVILAAVIVNTAGGILSGK